MSIWEWLFVLAVVSGFIVVYFWLKRRIKPQLEEADQQTRRKFEIRRLQLAGISSSVVGGMFVLAMLLTWPRVPVGNEPFAVGFLVFGVVLILNGAYKLYGSRR